MMSCDLTYIVLCMQEILHNMGVCCIYLKDYDQVRQCLHHAIILFYHIQKPFTVSFLHVCVYVRQ